MYEVLGLLLLCNIKDLLLRRVDNVLDLLLLAVSDLGDLLRCRDQAANSTSQMRSKGEE